MHMLHYYVQEFPIVTVHISGRFYFTMSFFQDQVARLANHYFLSYMYVLWFTVVGARLCFFFMH